MDSTLSVPTPHADVIAAVERLDSAAIAARLQALEREASALRILFKATRASERRQARAPGLKVVPA